MTLDFDLINSMEYSQLMLQGQIARSQRQRGCGLQADWLKQLETWRHTYHPAAQLAVAISPMAASAAAAGVVLPNLHGATKNTEMMGRRGTDRMIWGLGVGGGGGAADRVPPRHQAERRRPLWLGCVYPGETTKRVLSCSNLFVM